MNIQEDPSPTTFARPSYGPRTLTLGLGFVAIAVVLFTLHAPWWVWLAPAIHGLIWPHLAWYRTRNAADPITTENHHLLIDHFAVGMWTAAIAFSILPSTLLFAQISTNSLATGGPRQLWRGVAAHVIGVGAGLLVYGPHWQPIPSSYEILACLPLLILYPLTMGYLTHRAAHHFRQKQQELSYQSQHDGLSGLYNRRHWDACVQAEFLRFQRMGEPAALVMIDFDRFKHINDTLGHQVGDEVIRQFAQRLLTHLRRTDTPGRYGGEEFSLLLPNTTLRAADALMQRIRKNLHEAPLIEQHMVTISVGIASLTPHLHTHEAWMRLADQMLYRAKFQGRDRIVSAGIDHLASDQHINDERLRRQSGMRAENHVLAGLELGNIGVALFDPSDRLIWANNLFRDLFLVSDDARTFADIMHHCHRQQRGPLIECDDIAVWLAAADAKRRSQPHRSFIIDTHEGSYFQVEENSFENGWLLDLFIPHTGPAPLMDIKTPTLHSTPATVS